MPHRHLTTILSHKLTPILFLVLFAFIVGLFVVKDYGVSIDESDLQIYAKQSLDSYVYWVDHSQPPQLGPSNLRYYGPVFLMLVELAIRLTNKLGVNPDVVNSWHFSYFLLFLLGVISLYLLSCRWFKRRTSFLVAALFVTQPLLIGHSFINPKDTPFMSLFIICIYFGLRMIDTIPAENNGGEVKSRFFYETPHLDKRRKIYLGIIVFAWIITPILFFVFSGTFQSIVYKIVAFFYNAKSSTWYGKLFLSLAAQASHLPVENYANKAWLMLKMFGNGAYVLYSAGVFLIILRQMFPSIYKRLVTFLIMTGQSLVSMPVILFGILLGLTTSVRVIAPFAGLIIAAIALIKNPRKSFPLLVGASVWAILVCYFTWPYLWDAPVKSFIKSLSLMSQFPLSLPILFNGAYFNPSGLPYSYVPVLMSIQFTEPIVVLFWMGVLISFRHFRVKPLQNELLVLFLLWFVLPITYFILSLSPLYDNFRQLLFIVPPIFLMVGLTLEKLLDRIKSIAIYSAVAVLLLLPGVYSMVNLHPYEYAYYNSFAGGTRGAFRKFEMDYWMTSFHELAKDLNQSAPENSKVVIFGRVNTITPYLRSDLIAEDIQGNTFELNGGYDYAVLSSRWEQDTHYSEAPVLAIVERDGAIFSVLKYVQGTGP